MSASPHTAKAPRFTEVRNSKAHRDYVIGERFEAGLQLRGTEVKSIRAGRAQINDAFGRCERGELWLHNAHIEEYAFGNRQNHDARRVRKLLLHRHQIRKIAQAMDAGGKALVPLRLYFKQALVKVELALGTGKQVHDKRDDLREKAESMELKRAWKLRR
jgi:SsrA-binding protein